MLHGAPSQLLPAILLHRLLALARPGELLGAWIRRGRHALRLRAEGRSLLAGSDLGALLRRCNRIAIRHHGEVLVVEAERLIAWRTLQVVAGTPYLPDQRELQALFPELEIRGSSFMLPIGLCSPEEALAACIAAKVPVVASWIEYRG